MIEITDEMVDAGLEGFDRVHDMDVTPEMYVRSIIRAVVPLIVAAIRADDAAKWRYSPGYVSRGRDDERQG